MLFELQPSSILVSDSRPRIAQTSPIINPMRHLVRTPFLTFPIEVDLLTLFGERERGIYAASGKSEIFLSGWQYLKEKKIEKIKKKRMENKV